MSWRKLYKKLYNKYYIALSEPEEVDLNQDKTRHPFFCFTAGTYNTAQVNLKDTLRRDRPKAIVRVAPLVTRIKKILDKDESMPDAGDVVAVDWREQSSMQTIFTEPEEASNSNSIGFYKIVDAYIAALMDIMEIIIVRSDDNGVKQPADMIAFAYKSSDKNYALKLRRNALELHLKSLQKGKYTIWVTPVALHVDPWCLCSFVLKEDTEDKELSVVSLPYEKITQMLRREAYYVCTRPASHRVVVDAAHQVWLNGSLPPTLLLEMNAERYLTQLFARRFIFLHAIGVANEHLEKLETQWFKRFGDANNVENWKVLRSYVVLAPVQEWLAASEIEFDNETEFKPIELLSALLIYIDHKEKSEDGQADVEKVSLLLSPWSDFTSSAQLSRFLEHRREKKKDETMRANSDQYFDLVAAFQYEQLEWTKTGPPFVRPPDLNVMPDEFLTRNALDKALRFDLTMPLHFAKQRIDATQTKEKGESLVSQRAKMENKLAVIEQITQINTWSVALPETPEKEATNDINIINAINTKIRAFGDAFPYHIASVGSMRLDAEKRKITGAFADMHFVPDIDERDNVALQRLVSFTETLLRLFAERNIASSKWHEFLNIIGEKWLADGMNSVVELVNASPLSTPNDFFSAVATLAWIPEDFHPSAKTMPLLDALSKWVRQATRPPMPMTKKLFPNEWTDKINLDGMNPKKPLAFIYEGFDRVNFQYIRLQDCISLDILKGRKTSNARHYSGMELRRVGTEEAAADEDITRVLYMLPSHTLRKIIPGKTPEFFKFASQHRLAEINIAFLKEKDDAAFTWPSPVRSKAGELHMAMHMWRLFLLHKYLSLAPIVQHLSQKSKKWNDTEGSRFVITTLVEVINIGLVFGNSMTSNQMTVMIYDAWSALLSWISTREDAAILENLLWFAKDPPSYMLGDEKMGWNVVWKSVRSDASDHRIRKAVEKRVNRCIDFAVEAADEERAFSNGVLQDINSNLMLIPLLALNTHVNVVMRFESISRGFETPTNGIERWEEQHLVLHRAYGVFKTITDDALRLPLEALQRDDVLMEEQSISRFANEAKSNPPRKGKGKTTRVDNNTIIDIGSDGDPIDAPENKQKKVPSPVIPKPKPAPADVIVIPDGPPSPRNTKQTGLVLDEVPSSPTRDNVAARLTGAFDVTETSASLLFNRLYGGLRDYTNDFNEDIEQ